MKKSRITERQIAFAVQQAEVGAPVLEFCRKMGITEQTSYPWKKKFAGMMRRLIRLSVVVPGAYCRAGT